MQQPMVQLEIELMTSAHVLLSCQGNSEARFVDNPLDVRRPGVGVTCIYLFLEGIFYFILTLFIQVTRVLTWVLTWGLTTWVLTWVLTWFWILTWIGMGFDLAWVLT